jgi:hypothetical protein
MHHWLQLTKGCKPTNKPIPKKTVTTTSIDIKTKNQAKDRLKNSLTGAELFDSVNFDFAQNFRVFNFCASN